MSGPAGTEAPRPHVVKDAKGKRPNFYVSPGLDQAMSMVMVLANEISVIRDRLDAHERVCKAHGIDLAAEVEQLQFDQAALETRERARQDFLERLFYLLRKEATEATRAETHEHYTATIDEIAEL